MLGRSSTDNVVLCHEFVHHMRITKARRGSVMLKLDLEKAYDIIEWDFLEVTLIDAGLLRGLVLVIMRLVSAGSCRLVWNGECTDAIKPS